MAIAAYFAPTYSLALGPYLFPGYSALYTLLLNLAVAVALTPVLNSWNALHASRDETVPADYFA